MHDIQAALSLARYGRWWSNSANTPRPRPPAQLFSFTANAAAASESLSALCVWIIALYTTRPHCERFLYGPFWCCEFLSASFRRAALNAGALRHSLSLSLSRAAPRVVTFCVNYWALFIDCSLDVRERLMIWGRAKTAVCRRCTP
jgi:hypothetical protein